MTLDLPTSPTTTRWPDVALVTIDVQVDFVDSSAPSALAGAADVVPALTDLVRAFRAHGRPIVHAVRLYSPDGSDAEPFRRALVARGLVAPGTPGSQVVPELLADPAIQLDPDRLRAGAAQVVGEREWILYKPRWGAFYRTRMEALLRDNAVRSVAVAGVNFPNCPRATIYEASERDYHPVVVADAISGAHALGLDECRGIGADVATVAEVVDNLQKARNTQPRPG